MVHHLRLGKEVSNPAKARPRNNNNNNRNYSDNRNQNRNNNNSRINNNNKFPLLRNNDPQLMQAVYLLGNMWQNRDKHGQVHKMFFACART
jgi:hypothetical protein